MAYCTVSIGSGLVDSVYGKCQFPLQSYLLKRGEAFEQTSVLKKLFREVNSKHYIEGYSGETAMDDFEDVGEGGDYPRTGFEETFQKHIQNREFKQSFSVTQTLVEDGNLGTMQQRANKLITAYDRTREMHGRYLYAGGLYGTTVTVGTKIYDCAAADGKALFAKDHPAKVKGAAQSNLFAGDFTAENLTKAETRMQNICGDNGELLALAPDTILIPNDASLKKKVFEVIGADKDPATSNNAFNFQFGRWNVIVDPYLSRALTKLGKTDAPWILLDSGFIQQNDGAIFQNRVKLAIRSEIDGNNDNNIWKGRGRFGAGFVDWRFALAGGMTGGSTL